MQVRRTQCGPVPAEQGRESAGATRIGGTARAMDRAAAGRALLPPPLVITGLQETYGVRAAAGRALLPPPLPHAFYFSRPAPLYLPPLPCPPAATGRQRRTG